MNTVLDGLAENPALPPALLDRLIAVADPVLDLDLAARADLSDTQVRALLARDDPAVVSVLLENGRVEPADVPLSNPAVALVLTERPDTPPAVVRALAADPDFKIRLPEWACSLPPDVIELLAHDPDEHVVAELVTFHALPAALADELSRHPSTEVRRALAASPHTPADVLARLSRADFARELAGNPATPASVAVDLVCDRRTRYQLAARADLPAHVYEQLATDVEPGVLAELAANPAVPVPVLRQLTGTRAVQRALVRNPALPLDLLVSVAATAPIGAEPVPRVSSATEPELRTLATTVRGRMLVARRADLPPDLVQQLVADPDPGVAAAVVTNPQVSVDQLWALVERHGARLYPRVARNPRCPAELLHHMALRGTGVEETYRAIARHPHALGETLLLCLEDAQARHVAAAHPRLPVEKIVELLGREFTARPAAANPSLPVAVMEELLDGSGV